MPPVEIPITVWEQIPVVIVFALLLAGIAWIMAKIFSNSVTLMIDSFIRAIADINKHYSDLAEKNNVQWQSYINIKNEKTDAVIEELVLGFKDLSNELRSLAEDHNQHDDMTRQALDEMREKRAKLMNAKIDAKKKEVNAKH